MNDENKNTHDEIENLPEDDSSLLEDDDSLISGSIEDTVTDEAFVDQDADDEDASLEPDILSEDGDEFADSYTLEEELLFEDDLTDDAMLLDFPQEPASDLFDVDAALAAVSSLTHLTDEQATQDFEEVDNFIDDEQTLYDEEAREPSSYPQEAQTISSLEAPPVLTLVRGQLGSVIPAALLFILGAVLTFRSINNESFDPIILLVAIMGGIGISMLAYWITSNRWASGTLFIGSSLLLSAIVVVFLTQSGSGDQFLVSGFIIAIGIAFIAVSLLARQKKPVLSICGLMVLIVGFLIGIVQYL